MAVHEGRKLKNRSGVDVAHVCMVSRSFYVRFLALHSSMMRHCCGVWVLYAIALDAETTAALEKARLTNVVVIPLSVVLAYDRGLAASKKNRDRIAFYYTSKPSLMLYALKMSRAKKVVLVDADVYMYSNPDEILSVGKIVLVSHCFSRDRDAQNKNAGKTDAGFVVVSGPRAGEALEWWRGKCLGPVVGLYELGYLESWCKLFGAVYVESPCYGVAFFNTDGNTFGPGPVVVGRGPVVYAHYTGWEKTLGGDLCLCVPDCSYSEGFVEHVLVPYAEKCWEKGNEASGWADGVGGPAGFPVGCKMLLSRKPGCDRWNHVWGKYGDWYDCRTEEK